MNASKDQKEKKIDILEGLHYTMAAWWQVTQQTIENYIQRADYRHGQPSDVSDVTVRNEDDAFHHNWQISVAWIIRNLTATSLWTVTW
jgi:hypothetical protein